MPSACTPGSLAGDHLFLIFLIILLFAAYPAAFAALSLAFLRTFHLVLAGMVRRGAAFVFRTYGTHIGGALRTWGRVFGIASTLPRRSWGSPLVRPRSGTACDEWVVQPLPAYRGCSRSR